MFENCHYEISSPDKRVDHETLEILPSKILNLSSCASPRLHLDSSSYRSLVRILSLVLPPPKPETSLPVKGPTSSYGRGEIHLKPEAIYVKDLRSSLRTEEIHPEQEAGANTDGGTSVNRQEGDPCTDNGAQEAVLATTAGLVDLILHDFGEKENESCVNNKELSRVMLDCCRLINKPNEEQNRESRSGNEQECAERTIHNELVITKSLFHGAEEEVSHLAEGSEVAKGEDLVPNYLNEAEGSRKLSEDIGDLSEPVLDIDYEKITSVETQDGNSKEEEEILEVRKKNAEVFCTPTLDYIGLRNLKQDQSCAFALQIDEAEMEEGEISDDIQDLEDLVDTGNNEKVSEDEREKLPKGDIQQVASTTIFSHRKEVVEVGDDLPHTSEQDSANKATQIKLKVVSAKEKRKTKPLTEERKAKKKIAKKRKRAQKNREQGVKKLKLHAINKPKEVKYCNFYLMGRCQQGNLCKFSHDITPLTKSMPCKHFACNSCLKGDDCPYDHELSKYPCHNYVSSGTCNRGDRCKFSHKIPSADAASQLPVSKMDPHLTSELLKLKNPLAGTHAVSPLDRGLSEGENKGSRTLKHKPLQKANQAPKGIRFISFGTVEKNLTNKEGLPANKSCQIGAYNHHKQDNLLTPTLLSALACPLNSLPPKNSMMSSGLVGDSSSNRFCAKNSGNITKGSSIVTPPKIHVNHEFSEATKILEEFLLCVTD